jgi:tetratricopeptide (TPR) repeat protein
LGREPRQADAGASRRVLPGWAGFGLALLIVWLGGQFVRQGVSDELLAGRPELAVLWAGASPGALSALARQRLAAGDAHDAARLAADALRRAPLNASALATYGLAMERLGQPRLGDRAMTLAGERGWRDVLTQVWLFRRDLLSSHFAPAFNHADALLRRESTPVPAALQILALAVRDPRAVAPLGDRLAANPAWRQAFLGYLGSQARDPAASAALDALINRLASGPTPLTGDEVGAYVRSLVAQEKYQQAMQAWRRLLPASAGTGGVADGDFARTPGSSPFDWTLASAVGWTAAIGDSPTGGGQALNIAYDAVSPPQPVRQLLVLAPGAWRLSGRFYDEGGAGAPAFAWTVTCLGAEQPLAAAPAPPGPPAAWRAFGVDLTIPPDNCAAQWLSLKGQPADTRRDLSVWYTALAVTHLADAAPKPQTPGVPPIAGHRVGDRRVAALADRRCFL